MHEIYLCTTYSDSLMCCWICFLRIDELGIQPVSCRRGHVVICNYVILEQNVRAQLNLCADQYQNINLWLMIDWFTMFNPHWNMPGMLSNSKNGTTYKFSCLAQSNPA